METTRPRPDSSAKKVTASRVDLGPYLRLKPIEINPYLGPVPQSPQSILEYMSLTRMSGMLLSTPPSKVMHLHPQTHPYSMR